jgi:ArsR family transcriptional regulator
LKPGRLRNVTDLSETLDQLSALAQNTRLQTFRALMEASPNGMQAGAIAEHLGLAPNKLSGHLTILVNAGLVSVERDGRRMIYRAEIKAVNALLETLVQDCCHGRPEICTPLAELSCLSC